MGKKAKATKRAKGKTRGKARSKAKSKAGSRSKGKAKATRKRSPAKGLRAKKASAVKAAPRPATPPLAASTQPVPGFLPPPTPAVADRGL